MRQSARGAPAAKSGRRRRPSVQDDPVTKLDRVWAISEIDAFVHATDQVAYNNPPGSGVVVFGTHMRASSTEASERAHVVEQILDRVLPGWGKHRPAKDDEFRWLRDQASRGRAALQRAAELAEKLGDNAPEMNAANLHPWAWQSGASYWNSGHFHQAVMQAAIRINFEAQSKLGRMDVPEVDLFNQAFSLDDPKPGVPRLRLAKNDGGKTYESLHRGARALADGLYTAIRNPGMHTPQQLDGGEEQLALEQLAAFSLLARWVDQADVGSA